MFRITLFLILSGLTLIAGAQTHPEEYALRTKQQIQEFLRSDTASNKLYLEMPFAKDEFIDQDLFQNLEHNGIQSVELIYTRYKDIDEFNQLELNKSRYKRLAALDPMLFKNSSISWSNVEQLKGETKEEARKLFHGFVITYRPAATPENVDEEIDFLISLFEDKNIDFSDFKSKDYDKSGGGHGRGKTRRDIEDNPWYQKSYTLNNGEQKMLPTGNKKPLPATVTDNVDSSVTHVLKNNDWNKMLVVVDVTNSMSPYTAQVFEWFRDHLKDRRINHFVFFNDGDGKDNKSKKMGKTGGVYHTNAGQFDQVVKLSMKAMKKCKNNDYPENDFEALREGIGKCDECQDVVLIADNSSLVRDYFLIKLIDKPVRIIACGVSGRPLNIQYLDLARKTGGSVHSADGDLYDLDKIKTGELVSFGNYQYYLDSKGMFQLK